MIGVESSPAVWISPRVVYFVFCGQRTSKAKASDNAREWLAGKAKTDASERKRKGDMLNAELTAKVLDVGRQVLSQIVWLATKIAVSVRVGS